MGVGVKEGKGDSDGTEGTGEGVLDWLPDMGTGDCEDCGNNDGAA
jgi:hypothetical protein